MNDAEVVRVINNIEEIIDVVEEFVFDVGLLTTNLERIITILNEIIDRTETNNSQEEAG